MESKDEVKRVFEGGEEIKQGQYRWIAWKKWNALKKKRSLGGGLSEREAKSM